MGLLQWSVGKEAESAGSYEQAGAAGLTKVHVSRRRKRANHFGRRLFPEKNSRRLHLPKLPYSSTSPHIRHHACAIHQGFGTCGQFSVRRALLTQCSARRSHASPGSNLP